MAQTNPPGRFDYLFEDLIEPPKDIEAHRELTAPHEDSESEDVGYDGRRLDAYAREPVPWYRTTAAVIAMVAITVAMIAIVACAVLLVAGQSRGHGKSVVPSVASIAPPTTVTTPPTSASPPPPPESSPPPPADTASPVIVPTNPPRPPVKPPQTSVNRTPITRSPISVQPAPHPAFPRY